ncbi:MAG: 16S rRNA (guanine(527)-N(7))-methyltransferase RsmG [Alphaproteobacteria bacterium]|nr:16S rRNA (guanine(527)-N(7))-methyltransferase RsmG [Alphaproteobacteria bacterium]
MLFGPEEFAAQTGVSRETLAQLKAYADMLLDWNERYNLVSRSTLPDLWQRHVWDSAQLAPLISDTAKTLADLGSGAGFPGLVLAAMRPELAVTLHEATTKKCAFLQAAADRMGLRVAIENARMEDLPPRPFDVVTARACAPLPQLLEYAHRFMSPNSVCLFLKGQNVGSELTEAAKYWNIEVSQVPSQTDPSGAIVTVRELGPRHVTSQKTARPGRRQPKRRGR